MYVGRVHDGHGALIDEVLAFGMQAPKSYTGEDVVELQCHGGSLIAQRVLESVLFAGARAARPGEFTKRAFLNGRIDLAQAEAVADLIAARSEAGRRLATSQLQGLLSDRVATLRSNLLRTRAVCEVALDFPDEDVSEMDEGHVAHELKTVRGELEQLAATFERGRLRYHGARVALVGRPNVGKSSLLNALVGCDRALVTPIPGTTRDVVEASIALRGAPIVLMDTAGVRDTEDLVESLGVVRSLEAVDDSAAVIAVFDGASPLEPDDVRVLELSKTRPFIVVINKRDLPQRIAREDVLAIAADVSIIEISAATRVGIEGLVEALGDLLFGSPNDASDDEVAIYRVRHYEAVHRAIDDVSRAEEALAARSPLELVANDLAAASSALSDIVGDVTSEDVLDRVFADFCLGK